MAQTLTIDPVTRIEGHSKITIRLDDAGNVDVARLHITQFRGFEKFVEGRPFHEMPALTARTCGICPISHLLASAKACDDLMAVLADLTDDVAGLGTLVDWMALNGRVVERTARMLTEIRRAGTFDVTTLSVAMRQLRNLSLTTQRLP